MKMKISILMETNVQHTLKRQIKIEKRDKENQKTNQQISKQCLY